MIVAALSPDFLNIDMTCTSCVGNLLLRVHILLCNGCASMHTDRIHTRFGQIMHFRRV